MLKSPCHHLSPRSSFGRAVRITRTRHFHHLRRITSSADFYERTAQHRATRCYAATALADLTTSSDASPHHHLEKNRDGRLDAIQQLLENDLGGTSPWLGHLESAQQELQGSRGGLISVYGEFPVARRNIISALLRNPLAESPENREQIVDRYSKTSPEILNIGYAETSERTADMMKIPSPWLQSLEGHVEEINLIEQDEILDRLLLADVAVIVLDPIRLLSESISSYLAANLAYKTGLLLVVNGNLPYAVTESSVKATLIEQYKALSPNAVDPEVIFTRADVALEALDSLQRALHQPVIAGRHKSVEDFQIGFQTSRIGVLQNRMTALSQAVRAAGLGEKASQVGDAALASIDRDLSTGKEASIAAGGMVGHLVQIASRTASEARRLSVINRGIEGGLVEGGVKHTVSTAKRSIEQMLRERWSWLNLVLRARADVVGSELSSYLERNFGRDMEIELIFETGQLAQLQKTLSAQTDETLQRLASPQVMPHPLSSPVLINHLSTLTLSVPPYEATTLLAPIAARRRQLIEQAVPRLQLSAQRALLTSLGSSTIALAASWFCYVPPLAILSGPTAIGIGLLSIVGSAALGQRRWLKAQRTFWADWARITDMLRGDLQTLLDETITTNLLAKPLAAADGLKDIINRRERKLDDLQVKVARLRRRTRD